jgi:hypothetical protein
VPSVDLYIRSAPFGRWISRPLCGGRSCDGSTTATDFSGETRRLTLHVNVLLHPLSHYGISPRDQQAIMERILCRTTWQRKFGAVP